MTLPMIGNIKSKKSDIIRHGGIWKKIIEYKERDYDISQNIYIATHTTMLTVVI